MLVVTPPTPQLARNLESNQAHVIMQLVVVVKPIGMIDSLTPPTFDVQLVIQSEIVKAIDESTPYVLVDQHMVDGILIAKHKEEYQAQVNEIQEDRALACRGCLYFDEEKLYFDDDEDYF